MDVHGDGAGGPDTDQPNDSHPTIRTYAGSARFAAADPTYPEEYLWGHTDALLGELLLAGGHGIVTRTVLPGHPDFARPLHDWE